MPKSLGGGGGAGPRWANGARHAVWLTDTRVDGLGSNFHQLKTALALALRLKIGIVWNEQHFLSENTPLQDLLRPMGLLRFPPSSSSTPSAVLAAVEASMGGDEALTMIEATDLGSADSDHPQSFDGRAISRLRDVM